VIISTSNKRFGLGARGKYTVNKEWETSSFALIRGPKTNHPWHPLTLQGTLKNVLDFTYTQHISCLWQSYTELLKKFSVHLR